MKTDFRLVLKNTTLRGIDLPAGTPVAILPGAINRDPDRFECPAEFRVDRENLREHIAFGRGVHSCPGGPLARVEAKVSIERFLDRMDDIQLDDAEHGPESDRKFTWEPTYLLRGLNNLHLKYDPIADHRNVGIPGAAALGAAPGSTPAPGRADEGHTGYGSL